LQRNASVTELVSRLTCWAIVAAMVLVCTYALDPLLGFWVPVYYPSKLAVIAWLAAPQTLGAELLLQRYIEPALYSVEDAFLRIMGSPRAQAGPAGAHGSS
jgi:hypothetical protein